MLYFLARRLLVSIPVLLGIVSVTFLLFRVVPGDPCRAIYAERANEQLCAQFAQRYGLDQPLTTQYVTYIGQVLRGDLGDSIRFTRSVMDMLVERLPVTLELAIAALTFAVVVGVPLGVISAYRRNSALDVGTMLGANVGVSMPVFWLGLMLAYIQRLPARYPLRAAPLVQAASGLHACSLLSGLGAGLRRSDS
jgi:peptide/nickel transport system permease protein